VGLPNLPNCTIQPGTLQYRLQILGLFCKATNLLHQKMSSNFQSIPIIDLSLANSPATRSGLLQQLHQALIEVGLLYVSNHEVPQNVVSDLKEVLPRLFNLDLEHKEKVALYNSPHFLGYSRIGSETTAGVQDQREQFEFATELPYTWSEDKPRYERLKGPNQVCMLVI
jgi:isopenicillin N synthase-like dioxygenase